MIAMDESTQPNNDLTLTPIPAPIIKGKEPWRKGQGDRLIPYHFKPGQSGNPKGRPKGLTQTIRKATRDGKELSAFMLKVLRGEIPGKLKDRMEAAKWLAERGFGKSVQPMEIGGATGLGGTEPKPIEYRLTALTDQELATLDQLLRRAGEAPRPGPEPLAGTGE